MRKSEEDTVVELVLGYILCKMNDMAIRETDEGGKAWGKCGKKRKLWEGKKVISQVQ